MARAVHCDARDCLTPGVVALHIPPSRATTTVSRQKSSQSCYNYWQKTYLALMDKLWDIYCEDFWENYHVIMAPHCMSLGWYERITWLLMTWWLASPGYQQPWYWLLLRFVCQEGTSLQTPQHYCQFSVFPGYSSWSPEELKQYYLIHKCLLHHWYWYQNNFWGNMCAFSAELADGIALLYVRTSADQPMRLPVKIHPLHPHP